MKIVPKGPTLARKLLLVKATIFAAKYVIKITFGHLMRLFLLIVTQHFQAFLW